MILFILLLPINTYGDSIGVDEANELPWDLLLVDEDKDLELRKKK